jgi:hypothetical protein
MGRSRRSRQRRSRNRRYQQRQAAVRSLPVSSRRGRRGGARAARLVRSAGVRWRRLTAGERRRVRPNRRVLWAVSAGILAAAAIVSQFAIPPVLTSLVRAQLGRLGTVKRLAISYPFPAVTALTGHIDDADVHLGRLNVSKLTAGTTGDGTSHTTEGSHAGPGTLSRLGARVTDASVRVDEVDDGSRLGRNLNLQKRGPALRLSVALDTAVVAPLIGHALGLPAGTSVSLTARHGDPVVSVASAALGGSLTLTLFADGGALDERVQLSPAMAAQMGIPADPPARPMLHSTALSLDRLAVTQRGGMISLSVSGLTH